MRRTRHARHSVAHEEALARRFAALEAELASLPHADEEPLPRLDPGPDEAAPPLPVPGRHAARRSRRPPAPAGPAGPSGEGLLGSLRSRVSSVAAPPGRAGQAGEPGQWALGPAQLCVVALVVAVGLAVTAWWVVRSEPEPVPVSTQVVDAPPLLPEAVPSPGPATGAATAPEASASPTAPGPAGAAEADVVVHVAGEVRRPGLVVLAAGSRVSDALDAAGGARRGTDLTTLNLARPLVDGEQVVVGDVPGAPTGPAAGALGAAPVPGASAGPLVDLNTADQALLETLPGVGPVTATAILDWRAEHGGFTAVDELLEVDGIGEATLADLAPLVTV